MITGRFQSRRKAASLMARSELDRTRQETESESQSTLSPCRKLCNLLPDNTCGGCFRTLLEIATWGMMTRAQRMLVNRRIDALQQP